MTTMRFHVLANPAVPPSPLHTTDAFTTNLFRFYEMFAPHHEVLIYGPQGYDQHFPLATYVEVLSADYYTYDITDPRVMTIGLDKEPAVIRVLDEWPKAINNVLSPRYQTDDLVIHICDKFTWSHFSVGMIHVNWQQGCDLLGDRFPYVCAPTHYLANLRTGPTRVCHVIYPLFNQREFEVKSPIQRQTKTALYLARLIESKGFHVVLNLARRAPDWQFICAGGSEPDGLKVSLPENVVVLGPVGAVRRTELLHQAAVLLQPSLYDEPCGYNVIEAAIAGCPAITASTGGFRETVINGVTGFRRPVNQLDGWIKDLNRIHQLDETEIRRHGQSFCRRSKWYRQQMVFFQQVLEDYQAWAINQTKTSTISG